MYEPKSGLCVYTTCLDPNLPNSVLVALGIMCEFSPSSSPKRGNGVKRSKVGDDTLTFTTTQHPRGTEEEGRTDGATKENGVLIWCALRILSSPACCCSPRALAGKGETAAAD